IPSALGRDHEAVGIRRQRFRDQLFAHGRTIGIRRVYEVDAQLRGSAKNRNRGIRVLGRSPDAVAGDAHGAEADTVDGHFTAQPNGSTGTRGLTARFVVHAHASRVFLFTDPSILTFGRCPAGTPHAAPLCKMTSSGTGRYKMGMASPCRAESLRRCGAASGSVEPREPPPPPIRPRPN